MESREPGRCWNPAEMSGEQQTAHRPFRPTTGSMSRSEAITITPFISRLTAQIRRKRSLSWFWERRKELKICRLTFICMLRSDSRISSLLRETPRCEIGGAQRLTGMMPRNELDGQRSLPGKCHPSPCFLHFDVRENREKPLQERLFHIFSGPILDIGPIL